jgi:hypothetical protein
MKMRKTQALALLALLLFLLLLGTQMPGSWRDGALEAANAPMGTTKLAHFLAFAALAWVAHSTPLGWGMQTIVMGGLLLAVGTEGLQFFASNREPSVRDVLIDLAGVWAGLAFARKQKNKNGSNL